MAKADPVITAVKNSLVGPVRPRISQITPRWASQASVPPPPSPGPGPCLHTGPTPLAEELGLSSSLQSWWTTGMYANFQAGLRGGRSPAPQRPWKLEPYTALLGCESCSMNWTRDEKCMGGHGHGPPLDALNFFSVYMFSISI